MHDSVIFHMLTLIGLALGQTLPVLILVYGFIFSGLSSDGGRRSLEKAVRYSQGRRLYKFLIRKLVDYTKSSLKIEDRFISRNLVDFCFVSSFLYVMLILLVSWIFFNVILSFGFGTLVTANDSPDVRFFFLSLFLFGSYSFFLFCHGNSYIKKIAGLSTFVVTGSFATGFAGLVGSAPLTVIVFIMILCFFEASRLELGDGWGFYCFFLLSLYFLLKHFGDSWLIYSEEGFPQNFVANRIIPILHITLLDRFVNAGFLPRWAIGEFLAYSCILLISSRLFLLLLSLVQFHKFFVILALSICSSATSIIGHFSAHFLFIVFPQMNALFDFVSIVVTVHLLQLGLKNFGRRMVRFSIIDVSIAFFLFAALSTALAGSSIFWLRLVVYIDTDVTADQFMFVDGVWSSLYNYWWLFACMATTLLPSAFNLVVAYFAYLTSLFPPKLRRWLTFQIGKSVDNFFSKSFATLGVIIIFSVPVLPLYVLFCLVFNWM